MNIYFTNNRSRERVCNLTDKLVIFSFPVLLSSYLSLLLMTLMKLRVCVPNTDLAYRFGVSEGTVSGILNDCISILATRFPFLIRWPSKDQLGKNMPKNFLK